MEKRVSVEEQGKISNNSVQNDFVWLIINNIINMHKMERQDVYQIVNNCYRGYFRVAFQKTTAIIEIYFYCKNK